MGKREIRPLATPKPLNRSSQKVAHVITSWISTDMQNLVVIPPGVSFPRMREIAHQKCLLGFFFVGSSNELQPTRLNRFSRVIRQTTRFRAKMCLFGVRRRTAVLGGKFSKSRQNRAQNGVFRELRGVNVKFLFNIYTP